MPTRSTKNRSGDIDDDDGSDEKQSSASSVVSKPRLEGPERALKAAAIFVSSVDDFRFCAAVYGNPVRRDYWIGRLSENLATRKTELSVVDFAPLEGVRLLEGLRDHLQNVPAREGWRRSVAVIGLERHLPDPVAPTGPKRTTNRLLAEANLDRELFPRDCPVPILVWLTPTGVGSFARDAPDLWHWRSHVFDFEESVNSDDGPTTLGISELERAGAGTVYRNREEMKRAAAVFREGLKAATLAHGPSHQTARRARANLANVMRQLADYRQAEQLFRDNLSALEHQPDVDPSEVTAALGGLGGCLQEIGKFDEAEALFRKALEIDEKRSVKDDRETAIMLNNLAHLLKVTNRTTEAEPLMRRALAIDEKNLGPHHADVAIRLNNLAQLLNDTNRQAEAEPLARRAFELSEKSRGKDHPDVAVRLNNLAQILHKTGRLSDAEPLLRRALDIDQKNFGSSHPRLAIRLNNLARLMQDTNRLEEAEPLMRRALEILINSSIQTGRSHPNLEALKNNYAILRTQMGRSAEQAAAEIAQLSGNPKETAK